MRNFRVQVNGKSYDVVVEDMNSTSQQVVSAPQQVSPTPAPTPQVTPAPAPVAPQATPAPAASSANSITVPMPGVILSVNVNVGDSVSPNTVVAILEAMKMENEIFAGRNGVVESISAIKGSSVNTGDIILTLK